MYHDLTGSFIGLFSLLLFILAYIAIAMKEYIGVNKSKPALFICTFLFFIIGVYFLARDGGVPHDLESSVEHVILEISSIFFFLYVAMTYIIEALIERGVFDALKSRIKRELTLKRLLWLSGVMTFLLAPSLTI